MIRSLATILRFLLGFGVSLSDTILVAVRLKWQPFTGRARWIERAGLPKPDLQASEWTRYIQPPRCPHRDATGTSWCIITMVMHEGQRRPARACVQCHAYRLVLPGNDLSIWHGGSRW